MVILVIDGHATSRHCLAETIRAFGWRASVVDCGAAALAFLDTLADRGASYDAILIDADPVEPADALRLDAYASAA